VAAWPAIRHEEKVRKKQGKSKNENQQEKRGTRNRESSKINILEIIKSDFFMSLWKLALFEFIRITNSSFGVDCQNR